MDAEMMETIIASIRVLAAPERDFREDHQPCGGPVTWMADPGGARLHQEHTG